MTHDLLRNVLKELDTRVVRVVINELKDNTFFARIHLSRGDSTWNIDSRPSDAIALALRSNAEIFVEEEVLEKSRTLRSEGGEHDPERLKKWLEEVNPEDLGQVPYVAFRSRFPSFSRRFRTGFGLTAESRKLIGSIS